MNGTHEGARPGEAISVLERDSDALPGLDLMYLHCQLFKHASPDKAEAASRRWMELLLSLCSAPFFPFGTGTGTVTGRLLSR